MASVYTCGVMRVAMTAASVSATRVMMAASCSGDLPGPQMTSGKPVLAARHVSTYTQVASISILFPAVSTKGTVWRAVVSVARSGVVLYSALRAQEV